MEIQDGQAEKDILDVEELFLRWRESLGLRVELDVFS